MSHASVALTSYFVLMCSPEHSPEQFSLPPLTPATENAALFIGELMTGDEIFSATSLSVGVYHSVHQQPCYYRKAGRTLHSCLKGNGKRAQRSGLTSAHEGYHQGSCAAQHRRKVVSLNEQLNCGNPYKSCQSYDNLSSLASSLSAVIAR